MAASALPTRTNSSDLHKSVDDDFGTAEVMILEPHHDRLTVLSNEPITAVQCLQDVKFDVGIEWDYMEWSLARNCTGMFGFADYIAQHETNRFADALLTINRKGNFANRQCSNLLSNLTISTAETKPALVPSCDDQILRRMLDLSGDNDGGRLVIDIHRGRGEDNPVEDNTKEATEQSCGDQNVTFVIHKITQV